MINRIYSTDDEWTFELGNSPEGFKAHDYANFKHFLTTLPAEIPVTLTIADLLLFTRTALYHKNNFDEE